MRVLGFGLATSGRRCLQARGLAAGLSRVRVRKLLLMLEAQTKRDVRTKLIDRESPELCSLTQATGPDEQMEI